MSSSDDDPYPPPSADTSAFFFPGSGLSALLIHGLSGTPYEMRYLGEGVATAGIYFSKAGGSDIHDAAARRVHPGTRLMPLRAALNLVELSAIVRVRLDEVVQPALIIHSRRDHTCPYDKNVELVLGRLGSAEK